MTRMSCGLGWPQTGYVAKDDLELPDPPASTSQSARITGLHTTIPANVAFIGDQTQDC